MLSRQINALVKVPWTHEGDRTIDLLPPQDFRLLEQMMRRKSRDLRRASGRAVELPHPPRRHLHVATAAQRGPPASVADDLQRTRRRSYPPCACLSFTRTHSSNGAAAFTPVLYADAADTNYSGCR